MRLRAGRRPGDGHRLGGRRPGPRAVAGHLRLDRAVRPGRLGRLAARPRRPGGDRAGEAPRSIGVRVSGEYEVQMTVPDDIGTGSANPGENGAADEAVTENGAV